MENQRTLRWIRLGCVLAGLAAWLGTQSLIGARELQSGVIGDGIHDVLTGPNEYLQQHRAVTDVLLIFSSAIIDLLGGYLLWSSIFGTTIRPLLGLLMLFAMRQVCQWLCVLEPPAGMIWYDPGMPSLLVTYEVTTDFFFSGHTGLAVLGAVELARLRNPAWMIIGIGIVVFEVFTVLVLRAHYTMDVFTGAVAARYASILAARIAPWCDRKLDNWVGRPGNGRS